MPAATRAPKAITRMISVIGSESMPGLAEVVLERPLDPLLALASPNSPMVKPGWACWAAATPATTGSILSTASVPRAPDPELDQHRVPVLRDLAGVSGRERRPDVLDDRACRRGRATTSSIAASNAAVPAQASLWMRTLSPAGCLKPASRILSMRPDSPGPDVLWSMFCRPTTLPIATATTTKASQPKVAVFQ